MAKTKTAKSPAKKRGGKKAQTVSARKPADLQGIEKSLTPPQADDVEVNILAEDGSGVDEAALQSLVDPLLAGAPIEVETEDGNIEISFAPAEPEKDVEFDDNLAEHLDDMILGRISETLLEAIEEDERNRSEWIQQRADGLDLLGWKIERPGGGNVGTSSTAVPGQSTVRDGILGEACDRFQANAFAELCPSEGPCKVVDYGTETNLSDNLANEFEKDMNFYLTGSGGPTTATEYYPDTREMLFWTGYASGMFKKVYKCPIRNRPVSERVDGADLIVPSNATDLENAGRITHQINMRQSTMRRMQILGNYRDVPLTAPTSHAGVLPTKVGTITGMNPSPQREADQDYTIYECYCELDIDGFEHKLKGKITGLPLPYKVTLDKDSRVVLEIRRNWNPTKPEGPPDLNEDLDPDSEDNDTEENEALPVAKIPFVLFPFGTGLGIYGTGLLHRLGNYAMALTAMLRECIDAGMFASFPGFLFAKPLGRQLQNEFRVPPGGGAPIDVSATGNDINKAVMPLPYKDVSVAMVGLMGQTRENASRYGGTAEAPTGEGVINAPVGSVLAAIDQATRIEGGVHKALYAAQRKELGLIRELFRDDPEALWRGNKRPAMGQDKATRLAKWKLALENCDLVPASDPNVPSRMHRQMKAVTLLQVAQQFPGALIIPEVLTEWGQMVQIDIGHLLAPAPQGPPPPDALAVKALELKAQEVDIERQRAQSQAQIAFAGLKSKENIAAAQLAQKHAASGPAPVQQMPPDPMDVAELQLKARQIAQSGQKMVLDAHSAHADREARQNEKAMDLAARMATHPEAQPVVNTELQGLGEFLTPNAQENAATPALPGSAHGGPVQGGRHDEEERTARLAAAISEYIKSSSPATTH